MITLEEHIGTCRGCSNTQKQVLLGEEKFAGYGQRVYLCENCALLYLSPDFTDYSLNHFYKSEYRKLYPDEVILGDFDKFIEKRGDRRIAKLRVNEVKKYLPSKARLKVLEIGSGFGSFLNELSQCELIELAAVEPDATNALKDIGSAKVEFFSDISEISAETKFDLIVLFHVFEHVKYPKEFLIKLSQRLTDRGKLIIEVPDFDFNWKGWKYFHTAHVSYWSAKSISNITYLTNLFPKYVGANPIYELKDTLWFVAEYRANEINRTFIHPSENYLKTALSRVNAQSWNKRQATKDFVKKCILRLLGPAKFVSIKRALLFWN